MSKTEAEILEQQNTQFYRIKEVLGTDTLAFFCCCVMFDKPFIHECIPGQGGDWPGYLRKLKFRKKDDLGFRGGVTDVLQLYGDDVDAIEMVNYERSKNPEVSNVGTPEQVKTWGKGSDEAPFTKDDYDRLDDIFEIVSDKSEIKLVIPEVFNFATMSSNGIICLISSIALASSLSCFSMRRV